jgi:putative phosphoesterase
MGTARVVKMAASVKLRADGTLRLAAVADTHSHPHPDSARHLAALAPDAILHGGDVGDLSVLAGLERIAPVFAVRGNIDGHTPGLPDVLMLDILGEDLALRILITHIAVAGPRLRGEVAQLARAEGATLVVCGHSHVPFMGRDKGLTVFNPGSIGPRRFALPIVFGTIDVSRTSVRLAHVDCETGQPWSPPV